MIERFETHAHSHYSNVRSMLDSINKIEPMILTAYSLGMRGICLTDHEIMSGATDWLNAEKELKEKGKIPNDFKCGIGNEIYLVDERKPNQKYYHFILIAKDTMGFRQLCELSSIAWYNMYKEGKAERVPTLKSDLERVVMKNPGHLIAQTACLGGEAATEVLACLNAASDEDFAEHRARLKTFLDFCKRLFKDDFYLEIAPGESENQLLFNANAESIAKAFDLKMVFATDAHYLTEEDRYVHRAFLLSDDKNSKHREVDAFYQYSHLMSNEEAWSHFSSVISIDLFKTMCANTMEIYEKITGYNVDKKPIIPHVPVKEYPVLHNAVDKSLYPILYKLFNSDNIQERYWVNQCRDAMISKGLWSNERYLKRLEIEADIINTVGTKLENCLFEYFNTFQHFIDLFWNCGSLSGPGRGSSVCYLSNYLLGITQLDPLEWNLAEWRFLNKDRLELPQHVGQYKDCEPC